MTTFTLDGKRTSTPKKQEQETQAKESLVWTFNEVVEVNNNLKITFQHEFQSFDEEKIENKKEESDGLFQAYYRPSFEWVTIKTVGTKKGALLMCNTRSEHILFFMGFLTMDRGLVFEPFKAILSSTLQEPKITTKEVLLVAKCMTLVLQYLHSQKYVVCDLCSDNIVWTKSWNGEYFAPKIASLDLATGGDIEDETNVLSIRNKPCKSWAPELFKEKKFTEQTDMYALGVVLWEMLYRRKLFDPLTDNNFMEQFYGSGFSLEFPLRFEKEFNFYHALLETNSDERPSADSLKNAVFTTPTKFPAIPAIDVCLECWHESSTLHKCREVHPLTNELSTTGGLSAGFENIKETTEIVIEKQRELERQASTPELPRHQQQQATYSPLERVPSTSFIERLSIEQYPNVEDLYEGLTATARKQLRAFIHSILTLETLMECFSWILMIIDLLSLIGGVRTGYGNYEQVARLILLGVSVVLYWVQLIMMHHFCSAISDFTARYWYQLLYSSRIALMLCLMAFISLVECVGEIKLSVLLLPVFLIQCLRQLLLIMLDLIGNKKYPNPNKQFWTLMLVTNVLLLLVYGCVIGFQQPGTCEN